MNQVTVLNKTKIQEGGDRKLKKEKSISRKVREHYRTRFGKDQFKKAKKKYIEGIEQNSLVYEVIYKPEVSPLDLKVEEPKKEEIEEIKQFTYGWLEQIFEDIKKVAKRYSYSSIVTTLGMRLWFRPDTMIEMYDEKTLKPQREQDFEKIFFICLDSQYSVVRQNTEGRIRYKNIDMLPQSKAIMQLILQMGGIESNPGPPKYLIQSEEHYKEKKDKKCIVQSEIISIEPRFKGFSHGTWGVKSFLINCPGIIEDGENIQSHPRGVLESMVFHMGVKTSDVVHFVHMLTLMPADRFLLSREAARIYRTQGFELTKNFNSLGHIQDLRRFWKMDDYDGYFGFDKDSLPNNKMYFNILFWTENDSVFQLDLDIRFDLEYRYNTCLFIDLKRKQDIDEENFPKKHRPNWLYGSGHNPQSQVK